MSQYFSLYTKISAENFLNHIIIQDMDQNVFNNIYKSNMQGVKGLISRSVLSDESFAPVFKKAEEHRRATQLCIDYFQQINKIYEQSVQSSEKMLIQPQQKVKNRSYLSLIKIIKTVCKSGKDLTDNTRISFKELTSLCNTIFHQFSKFILNFQQTLRQYQTNQQIISQLIKKYYRTHKSMLASIEAYKNSFSDVALIYNMDQKIKRYNTCEAYYKAVNQEYEAINVKVGKLSEKKIQLCQICKSMEGEFIRVAQIIGSKIIGQAKNFFEYYCKYQKKIIAQYGTDKYIFEELTFDTFFNEIQFQNDMEIFQNPERLVPARINIPYIFLYHEQIKDEYLQNFNSNLVKYLKKVQQAIESRKFNNKTMFDFMMGYFKNIEKSFNLNLKQIMTHFEKMKKKLGQIFSHRLVSFIKSINSLFELKSGVVEKIIKRIIPNIQKVQPLLNQQSKLLKLFGEQLKSNIQKFVGKRQIKKIKQEQFTEETNIVNIRLFRKDITQKSEFIKHLIQGFNDKMNKNCQKIKTIYSQVMGQYYQSINQLFTYSCEYQQLYFGEEQFQTNFKKYQDDINVVLQKQKQFLNQLPIFTLKNDKQKIIFDGDFSRVQDFKKIKKPKVIKQSQKNQPITTQKKEQSISIENPDKKQRNESVESVSKIAPVNRQSLNVADDKQSKNAQYLANKIKFLENQKLLKSFSCALVQKIVLQGKIYITSQRICFHSNFNSGNVFFGGTFIQIPKHDIKKVEKKKNSFFLDNMISITTINGQVSFTSFFSRDQAYDLICKTFQISLDDQVYQFHEEQEMGLPDFLVQLEQQDDMKSNQQPLRQQQIQKLLGKYIYIDGVSEQIEKEGFNAFKFFKIFYANEPITMNKRNYPSFLNYIKGIINHKELEVSDFEPPLSQIINQSNFKSECPLKTTRKINVTVPVSAAGVPFMPKTAKSEQVQVFYFISKHKWILQSTISTSGAPYTDTFNVQLRTTVQSDQVGKNRLTVKYCVNFIKNTMMKAMIEGKTQQQTLATTKVQIGQINKYFINLQKSLNKKNGGDPNSEIRQQLEQKQKELNATIQQRDKIKVQVQNLKSQKQKGKYILIASLVINIILVLIALF